jgi:hypothetical protein
MQPTRAWLQAAGSPDPDARLHVLFVLSNPMQFRRRFQLAREALQRFQALDEDPIGPVITYVVELAYGDAAFGVTEPGNPRHLQVRTDTAPLWHKENLINMGVRALLPANWQAMAWVDADIEFEHCSWASEALLLLLGSHHHDRLEKTPPLYDVVQLFSHADDMDATNNTLSLFPSFGFQHVKGKTHKHGVPAANLWHPGFAWAMARRAYDAVGGLFDVSILGSGDFNMAMGLIGKPLGSIDARTTPGYQAAVTEWGRRAHAAKLRLGYVTGVIRHHFHGSKVNRKYQERWKYLVNHAYDPSVHVYKDDRGLLVPTDTCPRGLLADILQYFRERNEDEAFYEDLPPGLVTTTTSSLLQPPPPSVAAENSEVTESRRLLASTSLSQTSAGGRAQNLWGPMSILGQYCPRATKDMVEDDDDACIVAESYPLHS